MSEGKKYCFAEARGARVLKGPHKSGLCSVESRMSETRTNILIESLRLSVSRSCICTFI